MTKNNDTSAEKDLAGRVASKLTELEAWTRIAESAKTKSDALRTYVRDTGDLLKTLKLPETDEQRIRWDALGEIDTEYKLWSDLVVALDAFYKPISAASGEDRTEGDALCAQMNATISFPFWEDIPGASELTERAQKVISAWTASAPAKVAGSGSGIGSRGPRNAIGAAGKKVYCQCGKCGKVFSDSTGVNSMRSSAFLGHWSTAHNAGVKLGKDDQRWLDFTTAAEMVFKDGGKVDGKSSGFSFSDQAIGTVSEPGSTQVAQAA